MDMRGLKFNRTIKKKLSIIALLIALIFLFLISLIFIANKNKGDSELINISGKQRVLTQIIAKSVDQKYAILIALENNPPIQEEQALYDRLLVVDSSIIKAQNQFRTTLAAMHQGNFHIDGRSISFEAYQQKVYPVLEKLDSTWKIFDQYTDIITEKRQIDKTMSEAIRYVDNHNEELMNGSNEITQLILELQKQESKRNLGISVGILLVVAVLLCVSVFQLQKYIMLPLNELYTGIDKMGLLNSNQMNKLTKKEMIPVIANINEGVNKLNMLVNLISHINEDISFDDTLKYIYDTFAVFIPYEHIGIALLKDDGETLEASYGISNQSLGDLPQKMVGLHAKLGQTSLKSIILEGKPRVINDLPNYVKDRNTSYNKVLLDAGIKASITLPLKINSEPLGIIFFSSTVKDIYKDEHVNFLSSLADSISISFNKNIFIDELLYSNILALAKMAEARDEDTGDHLDRMKEYSKLLAELLVEEHIYEDQLTVRFIKDIERFSPMHDIGKVGIRDGILLKPAKLTYEEFEEMKSHTLYGAAVLRTAENNIMKKNRSLFCAGIEIAEGHHEKWNGSGYPHGIKGTAIPLSARIVAVADVFDALTSKRPYKKAFSFEDSFQMVLEGSGQHFDPGIITVFEKHKQRILELYNSFEFEQAV